MADDDEGMSPEEEQEFLYDIIGFIPGESRDETAHSLFWDAMYNDELTIDQRIDKFDELSEYIYEEYGLFIEDVFDWDDFRAWYESQ